MAALFSFHHHNITYNFNGDHVTILKCYFGVMPKKVSRPFRAWVGSVSIITGLHPVVIIVLPFQGWDKVT